MISYNSILIRADDAYLVGTHTR